MGESFIKDYSEEFQERSKRLGYDDETIRRTLLGNLFERGFDREQVTFVIHVDEVEWLVRLSTPKMVCPHHETPNYPISLRKL